MYRVIIECSVQNRSNSGVRWLPWPSRISSRYTPLVQCTVCFSNTFLSQVRPKISSVQPFSLSPITQSPGSTFCVYQVFRCNLPSKMMTSSRLWPSTHIQSIAVTYSQFPGCTKTGLLLLSAPVITLAVKITPI
jgi:hypothetical protein